MWILVFWVTTVCILVYGYHCFTGTYTFIFRLQGTKGGVGMFLWIVGNHLQNYAASSFGWPQSIFSLLWRIQSLLSELNFYACILALEESLYGL
jgi:hypothetical protein